MKEKRDSIEKRPLTDTQKKIKEILLKEISSEKAEKVREEGKKIISPQTYYSTYDPDMSDLSVAFYEILYKDILPGSGKILQKDTFCDKAFAGDTMFTFRKLKKSLLIAHKDNMAAIKRIEEGMERLEGSYHCLANFWLIPMMHGRRYSKPGSGFDSPDMYLKKARESLATYKEQFPSYYGANPLKKIESCHHFKASEERIGLISERNERIIEEYLAAIDTRAEEITVAHEKELSALFKKYALM